MGSCHSHRNILNQVKKGSNILNTSQACFPVVTLGHQPLLNHLNKPTQTNVTPPPSSKQARVAVNRFITLK